MKNLPPLKIHKTFELEVENKEGSRAGILDLPGGKVPTPVFMPVGTQASVKTIDPEYLYNSGTEIILSNTYHLYLRP